MPRYGTRTLLVVIGIITLWLATFAGHGAAQDLRRSMLLLALVAAGCLAIYSDGRRRAFWAGFAIVMFLCGGLSIDRPLHRYVPDFFWTRTMTESLLATGASRRQQPVVSTGLVDSMTAGWTLALSALAGFVAAQVYSRTRPAIGEASLSARQIVEQELHDLR